MLGMREITEHVVPGDASPQLKIYAEDKRGSGGANYRYVIVGFDSTHNPSGSDDDMHDILTILYQNGPIKEAGVNGVSNEALLAVVIDRLRSFQAGPFSSPLNEAALEAGLSMLGLLKSRTVDRIARGVEGVSRA